MEQLGREFGADGWEIDYHAHPRPTHEGMGGKQYAIGKAKVINRRHYKSFSEVEGLLSEYGCLHLKFPIILGVSEPTYTDNQLDKFETADKKTFKLEGKHYTKYKASQVQRKLETSARHSKDRQIIAKAAGDDTLRRKEQERINLITSKYAKFSKAAGLPTKAERMSVGKYHRVKTEAQLLITKLKGVIAANGTVITRVSQHIVDQTRTRKIQHLLTETILKDTLQNPLDIGKIKTDKEGRPSQKLIGKTLTLCINNKDGTLTTVWQTSSKRAEKLKKGKK